MLSPEAVAALQGGHTAVAKVDVWRSGKPVATLVPISGSVAVEADSPVRRSLTCTLVDPTGRLTVDDVEELLPDPGSLVGGNVGDLLNAYECEIAVYRGVRVTTATFVASSVLTPNEGFGLQPFGTSGFGGVEAETALVANVTVVDEYEPLGVFRLTGRDIADSRNGLTISLTGQDRAIGYQVPMSRALPISAGTPVETAIQRLLSMVQPGLSLQTMRTRVTVGPLLFQPESNVWTEAQKLAESVGARLFHDRNGQVVLAPVGVASDLPVASYEQGDGLLLDVDRSEDSDTINNVVVAESEDGRIRVMVEDDDPTSPTYARGRYGRHVYQLKNPYFGTTTQASQAARARLAYELGRSETVNITVVPDPTRDVDEVISVHRPRSGLIRRGLVVASLDIPLAATDAMRIGCRESRLARDGGLLPNLLDVQV